MKRLLVMTVALAIVPRHALGGDPAKWEGASSRAAKLRAIMNLSPMPEVGAVKRINRTLPCDGEVPQRGVGMIVGGGLLIFPAAASTLMMGSVGSVGGGNREESDDKTGYRVGMWALGLGALAAGIVLIVVGTRRHRQWREWKDQQVLAPTAGRTGFGTWTPGLSLRF